MDGLADDAVVEIRAGELRAMLAERELLRARAVLEDSDIEAVELVELDIVWYLAKHQRWSGVDPRRDAVWRLSPSGAVVWSGSSDLADTVEQIAIAEGRPSFDVLEDMVAKRGER